MPAGFPDGTPGRRPDLAAITRDEDSAGAGADHLPQRPAPDPRRRPSAGRDDEQCKGELADGDKNIFTTVSQARGWRLVTIGPQYGNADAIWEQARDPSVVMAGLVVPAIHVFCPSGARTSRDERRQVRRCSVGPTKKTWLAGTSPAMTGEGGAAAPRAGPGRAQFAERIAPSCLDSADVPANPPCVCSKPKNSARSRCAPQRGRLRPWPCLCCAQPAEGFFATLIAGLL
jgi:hypothetical protein